MHTIRDRHGGPWAAHRHARDRRRAVVATVALTASTNAALAARARLRNRGATPDEVTRPLPGDDLVTEAASTSTRAVTIHAPRDEVWRWLVQIGREHGGRYSYDWLENPFGLDLRGDVTGGTWHHLAVGTPVRAAPPGAQGPRDDYAFQVARVDPGKALVLSQHPPQHPWHATWAFVMVEDAPGACRLLVRGRATSAARLAARLPRVGGELVDPVVLIMTRKMLLGVRARSEFAHDQRSRRAPGG
ncbi:SRPBCC family protein [Jiangella asiatica]|uniref:SRPBCC family protein n=1 Tax=Jiangella asiatica TaxID=2530372 RepID=A0A4R5DG92_9ACTN|nr:SRPBCC family protein [Jiangella asiatica]TDE12217.1 SRPBCC family protein [Jiangella asiatica]